MCALVTGVQTCALPISGLGLALPATAQDKSAIETERPWARASIGTARPAAAYGTLVTTGSEAMRLVAVETPVAGRAETHRTVRDGAGMRMETAEIVEVPAGAIGTAQWRESVCLSV